MATKFFCDSCGTEITTDETGVVVRQWGDVQIEVKRVVKVTSGTPERPYEREVTPKDSGLCQECTSKAVAEGVIQPKPKGFFVDLFS